MWSCSGCHMPYRFTNFHWRISFVFWHSVALLQNPECVCTKGAEYETLHETSRHTYNKPAGEDSGLQHSINHCELIARCCVDGERPNAPYWILHCSIKYCHILVTSTEAHWGTTVGCRHLQIRAFCKHTCKHCPQYHWWKTCVLMLENTCIDLDVREQLLSWCSRAPSIWTIMNRCTMCYLDARSVSAVLILEALQTWEVSQINNIAWAVGEARTHVLVGGAWPPLPLHAMRPSLSIQIQCVSICSKMYEKGGHSLAGVSQPMLSNIMVIL